MTAPVRLAANSDQTYLHRPVLGDSVAYLNNATMGIRSKNATRIVDSFSLALVLPNRFMDLRKHSRLVHPPTMEELAERLGNISIDSLWQPVTAEVQGVEIFNDDAGAQVGVRAYYPEHESEVATLRSEINDLLQLPPNFKGRFGPIASYIGVVFGGLAIAQINRIQSHLPNIIELGATLPASRST